MAYQHSQLARECSKVRSCSARLLLMVLASAMDKDTNDCGWKVSTVLFRAKMVESTYIDAMKEIEKAGIITRERRKGRPNRYVWHLDVAEALRELLPGETISPRQKQEQEEADEQAEKHHEGSIHADEDEETPITDNEALCFELIQEFNQVMQLPYGDAGRASLEAVQEVFARDPENAEAVIRWVMEIIPAGRFQEFFPKATAGRRAGFGLITKSYDALKARMPVAVQIEED